MFKRAALLLPALALANPLQKRQSSPSAITIANLSSSGSGCPQGSVSTSVSTDGTVVTLGFDSFQTYIGPGETIQDESKSCELHLSLDYPGGFEYAVVDAVYHGYAQLDPGVTGTFLSTYYFSENAADTTTTRTTISGAQWEAGNEYTKEDDVPSTAVIWSPCGDSGILNINNRVSLSANSTTAAGQLTDDDATVAFTHQIHVSWQPCTSTSSSSGGGSFGTDPVGAATAVTPERDVEASEVEERAPAPQFSIGPGTTSTTPSGEPCLITPWGCFEISNGTVTVVPGKE